MWCNSPVQFARLLWEIQAVGLTDEQMKDLCVSMGLKKENIEEILDRAHNAFELYKADATKTKSLYIDCPWCKHGVLKQTGILI